MTTDASSEPLLGATWNVRIDLLRKRPSLLRPNGQVVAKPHDVVLSGVSFHVSQTGRRRSLQYGWRTVHAFARGELVSTDAEDVERISGDSLAVRLHYNPLRQATFVDDSGAPVHGCALLAISGTTAWVVGPR